MKPEFLKGILFIISNLFLILSACSTKESNSLEQNSMNTAKNNPNEKFTLAPVDIKLPQGMTVKDMNDMFREKENQNEYKKFSVLTIEIAEEKDYKAAHLKAKEFIDNGEGKMLQFLFVQQLSHFILRQHLLNSKDNSETKINLIEYHLNNLIKYNSYADKIIFAQSLMQLKDKWSSDKIAEIAKNCLEFNARKPMESGFDFEKIKVLSVEERKKIFMNGLMQKHKMPIEEALKHAEIMERTHQDRINNKQIIPHELPIALVAQEQAIKNLANLAGEKFTSFADRHRSEGQK